jgi:hypothetical protein
MEPAANNSPLLLELRRYGDSVTYTGDDQGLTIAGKHLFGGRYVLRLAYSELRPDYHSFWPQNSRQPVQLSLVLAFFVVFVLCVTAMWLVPQTSVAIGALVCIALLIGALLASAFAGRVEVTVFRYHSGVEAFRVPKWGCAPGQHQIFVDALCERITKLMAEPPAAGTRAT